MSPHSLHPDHVYRPPRRYWTVRSRAGFWMTIDMHEKKDGVKLRTRNQVEARALTDTLNAAYKAMKEKKT